MRLLSLIVSVVDSQTAKQTINKGEPPPMIQDVLLKPGPHMLSDGLTLVKGMWVYLTFLSPVLAGLIGNCYEQPKKRAICKYCNC